MRQDKTGHCRGRGQPGNRIQAKLRQPGKSGQQQGREAEDRGQHSQADGRPETLDPALLVRAILFRLHEQVDGVVHRLADQRGAESQGDAMHRAKAQTDCRNPCQRAADHGQKAQGHRGKGAIHQQQQGGDERDPDDGQAADLAFDALARGH